MFGQFELAHFTSSCEYGEHIVVQGALHSQYPSVKLFDAHPSPGTPPNVINSSIDLPIRGRSSNEFLSSTPEAGISATLAISLGDSPRSPVLADPA
jgi:hypothetical protein